MDVYAASISVYMTTKYKVTTNAMGATSTAWQWVAPEFDPMPVRVESEGVLLEMRNIKEGSQDAALFDVPSEYRRDLVMEEMMKAMFK